MDFEDQEDEQEGEMRPTTDASYDDSLVNSNSTRPHKTPCPAEAPPRKPRYRECLKNHAIGIGGHAVDGCGEFIPAGDDGTLESLRCAACSCHRNFHRKESDPSATAGFAIHPFPQQQLLLAHHHHHHHPHGHLGYRNPSRYLHMAPPPPHRPPQTPRLLALPSSSGGGGQTEEMEDYYYSNNTTITNNCNNPMITSSGKKRFRTKFTQEQKDKMLNFAEHLGWKIQKQDEEIVQQFCNEVGIKRHVLKVWMHNNKHTLGKKT